MKREILNKECETEIRKKLKTNGDYTLYFLLDLIKEERGIVAIKKYIELVEFASEMDMMK